MASHPPLAQVLTRVSSRSRFGVNTEGSVRYAAGQSIALGGSTCESPGATIGRDGPHLKTASRRFENRTPTPERSSSYKEARRPTSYDEGWTRASTPFLVLAVAFRELDVGPVRVGERRHLEFRALNLVIRHIESDPSGR